MVGNAGKELNSNPPLKSIDGWVLSELGKLSSTVIAAFNAFEFKTAQQALYDFCNDTLSSIYLAAVKDRLYCDSLDSPRRIQTASTIRKIADTLIRLLAPFMPHTADEAWQSMHGDDAGSVHLQVFLDVSIDSLEEWGELLNVRDEALKALEEAKESGLENPLDAGLKMPETFKQFEELDLADLCGVSKVIFEGNGITVMDLRDQPRCDRSWKRDGTVKSRSDGGMLSNRDAKAVGVE